MKPAPFHYHRPRSLAEALALLAEHGTRAKAIAGGQSLAPMMNMRLAQPEHLVDLNMLPGLDEVRSSDGALEIGALTTHHALATSPLVRERCPLLAQAAQAIGHYAIRTRGTLGGSLAHADPAAQLPLVAATVDAELVVAGPGGERRLAASGFFVSLMTTTLEPDELIVRVRFPAAAAGERHAFLQFSRRLGDFAIVAVAAILHGARLRLGIGGAQDTPLVLAEFPSLDPGEAGRKARDSVDPSENPRVSALYRRELVEVLSRRAVQRCLSSS